MELDRLSTYLLQQHPKYSARILQQYDTEDVAAFFENISPAVVANVIKEMIPTFSSDCLNLMSFEHSSKVIVTLGIEKASLLMRKMKIGQRVKFIRSMPTVFANRIRLVLRYPEGTVGNVMNPNVFSVNQDMTVHEVINALKKNAHEVYDQIFVVDEAQNLAGVVSAGQLLATENVQIKRIMREPDNTIPARSNLKMIMALPEWGHREYFPVVDHTGVFIGTINKRNVDDTFLYERNNRDLDDVTGTALVLAELFWDTCANIIAPENQFKPKGQEHE